MVTTSLNELTYELMELHRGELKNTDSLHVRIVRDWVQSKRAKLLRQQFAKPFRIIDDHLVQNLGDVSMEIVDSFDSETPIITSTTGNKGLRTSIEIPRTIERREGTGTFTRIGPSDAFGTKYNIVTYDRALKSGNGKFNRNNIYAFILGDRIYLYSKSDIHLTVGSINLQGVFQDPIAAALIADPTWDYDDDYPINKSMIDYLKGEIVDEKFKLIMTTLTDKIEGEGEKVEQNVAVPKRKA